MRGQKYRHFRFLSALNSLIFSLVLIVPAHAHDPGLSAIDIIPSRENLSVHLSFARGDIESLMPVDADRNVQLSEQELAAARPQLESLCREAIEISIDDTRLTPNSVDISTDDGNAIHFKMLFTRATGSALKLRSALLARLPFGHKQFLTLRGSSDEARGAKLLDIKNDLYSLDLGAIAEQPQTFRDFLGLGIEHILIGFDHIAFLLALLLAGGSMREAFKIISSFTAAHSITLALATLNLVTLPSSIVEPLIAVSIVYVGLENLLRKERNHRWMLTFGFGLIHGFGFASVLQEIGIGKSAGVALPLLSFNLGVELGQIAIAALVLPVVWKLHQQPRFVLRYLPACSILIAIAGGYWLIERTLL
jgi:hydrogenase/urease accessory protein HupE